MYSNKHKKKNKTFKLLSIFLFLILLGFTSNNYLNNKYKTTLSEFYTNFNNYEFSDAKSIINNKVSGIKKGKLNSDLTTYFTNIVNKICLSLSNNEINSSDALEILNEIKNYNVLNSSLDKLIIALSENPTDSSSTNDNLSSSNELVNENENLTHNEDNYLNLGISSFKEKDYETAMEYFYSIPKSSKEYEIAKGYIQDFEENYKNYLLESIDELVANKYYTKALEILSNYDKSLLNNDEITEIENKIKSIKMFREEYQEYDSEYTSNAILQEITPNNINTFSISSNTPYLVYLNLEKQITYIYKISNNNWSLIKEFNSSTGIEGEETPKGIFSVTNRGDWFFSEEYQQGANIGFNLWEIIYSIPSPSMKAKKTL